MPGSFLITVLYPFIKEIITGKRLVDPNKKSDRFNAEWFKDIVLGKLQSSRRVLIAIILILVASLTMNYRIIENEISFSLFRDKEHPDEAHQPTKEPKETPTVPKPIKPTPSRSEKDDLYDQAMKELSELYKEL